MGSNRHTRLQSRKPIKAPHLSHTGRRKDGCPRARQRHETHRSPARRHRHLKQRPLARDVPPSKDHLLRRLPLRLTRRLRRRQNVQMENGRQAPTAWRRQGSVHRHRRDPALQRPSLRGHRLNKQGLPKRPAPQVHLRLGLLPLITPVTTRWRASRYPNNRPPSSARWF